VQTCVGMIVLTMLAASDSGGAATSSRPRPAAHTDRTDNCATCHRFPVTRTHVTGVRPTFDVPVMYPLDERGELTCVTCHENGPIRASNGRSSVRGPLTGSAFCSSCHRPGLDAGSRLAHAVRAGAAHAQSPRPASVRCRECHDGVIGEDDHRPVTLEAGRSGLDSGHPTDVLYARAELSSQTLTPVRLLNTALRLDNGTVGCISCHDAFSTLAAQLAIDNRGSALCTACHRI
jgi:predicted CXXCH cytochrome family protein